MAYKLPKIVVCAVGIALVSASGAQAGFGNFFKNIQKNIENDAKKKAEDSKKRAAERAKQRAEEAQRKAISNVSQGVVDGEDVDLDNFKDSYKEKFKEGVEQKAKDKATEITPLAACDNKKEMKGKVKLSFQDRIDAMKARLNADKMVDNVVEGTTGVDMSSEEGEDSSFSDRLDTRLKDLKNTPGKIVEDKVSNTAGGMDSAGLSANNIDLNTASASEFAAIDGIELSDGYKIVSYRNSKGTIESRDLIDVIGYQKYLILRTQVREDVDDDDEDDFSE